MSSKAKTFASRLGATTVAGVAGFASYQHIHDVALKAGETATVAIIYPLAIDGLIIVGSMAMLADKSEGRLPRFSARVAIAVGVIATLAANVASAHPTLMSRLVAAMPAVAFMIAVEVLSRTGKPKPAEQPTPAPAPVLAAPVLTVPRPAPVTAEQAPAPAAARRVRPVSAPPAPVTSTAEQVTRLAARHPELTAKQIGDRLGISDRTARRYMPKPTEDQRTADRPGTPADLPVPALV
ncbi:DUF2637 domain-containing protein [Catellatospora citrea]|uniref:DUF2637 domain-containing protein n=1 Tax=Catellatospora citrea TaxID=53366 RepID=A0A8J3KM96_9ACTN|nr:DUF2637 domain-containing protein [Catellatospora citrea]RKE08854.1 uncharacterized protein DUF2637 [Catellatospora citrea]GIG01274.1 hypothetical protein Cci01nite_63670 [Catellatospora citrea]